jgi:erythronate-4-phosphate dehydrogenase
MNVLADASLPGVDAAFPKPFKVTKYSSEHEIAHLLPDQDVLICRSTFKANGASLTNNRLHYIATASSGTDHLDKHYLNSHNIQIIDAKGCNATSVADYVVSCLAYLKPLLKGRTAGIIGMGTVGMNVYQRLSALKFQIYTYDPLKAEQDSLFRSCSITDLFQCDLLCIHAELHNTLPYPSINLIDHDFLSQIKTNCIIINAARGGIVNEEALLNASSVTYCTDVYVNEPEIDHRIINKATLCTPHIAGHSLEAKYAAVSLVSEQLHHILGLKIPVFDRPSLTREFTLLEHLSWEATALSLYNPLHETLILKNAIDKREGFLSLRKKHQIRHDFRAYYELCSMPVPLVFS